MFFIRKSLKRNHLSSNIILTEMNENTNNILPAFISVGLDLVVVILYFKEAWLFGDILLVGDHSSGLIDVDLLIVIFAGLRIIFILPYLYYFQQDRRLNFASAAYVWHMINLGIIVFKVVCDLASHSWILAEWLLALASFISVFCQTICLNHLKSTALPERHVVLGFSTHPAYAKGKGMSTQRKEILLNTDHPLDESFDGDTADSPHEHSGSGRGNISNSSDFLNKMRNTFDKAKSIWNEKVGRLKYLITGTPNTDEYQSVFDGVLLLFTGHGSSAVKKLESLYKLYPDEVEFYIPQLVVFLVYGSFETSGALQASVLHMCRRSAVFAHRIYWFIVAFCLSGAGVTKEGVVALQQLLSEIEAIAEDPAKKLACGQIHADDQGDLSEVSCHSEDALGPETKASPAEFTSISIQESRYPLNMCKLPPGCTSYFAPTLLFWDKMTEVSRGLTSVPRNDRTEELKTRLAFVNDFLPSSTVYAPFGNQYHRVWAVHIEECFAFSTKDRVPFLVCLEIVDYEEPKRKLARRLWWSAEKISFQKTFRIGQREFTLKLGGGSGSADSTPNDDAVVAYTDQVKGRERDREMLSTGKQFRQPINNIDTNRLCFSSTDTADMEETRLKSRVQRNIRIIPGDIVPIVPTEGTVGVGGAISENDPCVEIGQWGAKGEGLTASESLHGPLTSMTHPILSSISNPLLSISALKYKRKPKKVSDNDNVGNEHIRLYRKGDGMGRELGVDDTAHSDSAYTPPAAMSAMVTTAEDAQSGPWISSKTGSSYKEVSEASNGSSESKSSGLESSDKEWYGSTDHVKSSDVAGVSTGSEGDNAGGGRGLERGDSAKGKGNEDGKTRKSDRRSESEQSEKPTVVFKESWKQKEARLRRASLVGHLPGWRLLPVIVKSGDDLRQEQCASQIIFQMHHILEQGCVGCWLRPYGIVAISPDSGIIEAVQDTVSLDVLKRRDVRYVSLMNFFERFFGPEGSLAFTRARANFMKSLAGYCIVCYLLQLKDRHNGNILLDTAGHIIHIDFGFMLARSPGGNIGFEKAPFKLTNEFVDLLDGAHSPCFHKFRELCVRTYMELRRNSHRIVLLLEMLSKGNEHLPCFGGNPQRVLDELRVRFQPELHDRAAMEHVHSLIDQAIDNWTTTCYDSYQRCCVGIF